MRGGTVTDHIHFAIDPDRPDWTTPFYDVNGDRVGEPMRVEELEKRTKAIREEEQ